TTKKLLAKEQIRVANLENSGELGTNSSLTVDGKLENKGKIQAVDKIDISSSAKNEGEILTNSTFTAKDVNTSNKLIALGDISTSNLINSGKLATQGNLTIDGALTNSDEIQVAKNITVALNAENTGDILTDGSFSAKDTKTTKKLLAKEQITVANLENSGELGTNSSLTVDGKLENKGKIQAVDKIDISSSAKNEGEILTNSTFTAKDVNTSNKLIALGDISTSNLKNSGKLATQGNLSIDGVLTNSDEIQVAKNITVALNAENTGDILTDGSFSAKDVKTTKTLVAKDSIDVGSLTNDGLVATDSNLNIKGKLVNTKDIKANKEITVLSSADNSGDILTNSSFTAKDITNTKKLIAVDKISVANLKNDGDLATNSTLTVEGTLKNTKNIQAAEAITISSSADNSGIILTNSTFTAKDTTNTKKIVAKDSIKTDSLLNTDTIATDGSLTVVGDLKNSGDINVVKEITVDKNAENIGIILTNSSFSAKDTKTTNKLVAIGEITTKNLINEGELATKSKLNIDGTLENKKNIQAVDNITVSSNVKNDGTILTDANFSSKDIVNTKTLIARENINSGMLDNSGVFSAGENLIVNGSVNNSKTMEATNIDITGASLTNTSSIKADNIVAIVNSTKNDGEILALNDITLNTKKLNNTKKIGALGNIIANNTVLTNSGEIVSNNKIELNNSDINNSNKILSNTIEMKNATNFNNTGTIKGTDVTLTTKKDINLVANLHGENSLIIEGNNIVNNGNTTGKNLISIKSNNFTNKKELSSKNLKINAGEDVLNENVISAETIKINANNLTNNDLIAAEKDLNITTKNKVINSKNHTIYAGDQLNIKASEILNDTAEILGNNVRLEANHILNHTGTLQALNNMYIKSSKFENIGEVEDLDKYESYYETWDGQIIEANQIEEWKIHFSESSSKRTSGSAGSTISRRQRREFNNMVEKINSNKYKALLFPKYTEIMRNKLGQNGYYTEKTGSAKNPEIPLKEKLRSLGKTTHAKVLAGNNILIEKNSDSNNEVINKDGIISAENIVKIDANKVENLVSVGDEKIKVKTGQETFFMKREKTGKRHKKKVRMEVTYTRDFADDYITKRVQKLDENGNPVYRRGLGRKRPVYINVTEYVGRYAYVTGQPSVIEGKKVLIDSASLVKQDIEEANGYIKNRNDVVIQDFSNKTFNTGISNINQNFNFDSTKTNISKIDIKDPLDNISTGLSDIQNPVTSVNNDLKIDDKLNKKDNITDLTSENVKIDTSTLDNQEKIQNIDTNTKKIEIFSNMDSIKEILRSGKIDILPNLPSSLFIKNLEPTGKYVMETRLKHISLSSYYGSDYFLNKVGYEEKWDRVKRLGDAFYENQLVERSIIEKLGTRFLNGTAISMKQLIDNASIEAPKLNLVIGQALTKEQISSLDKDIVWYEYQDVSGLKVLAPKVYLSKNTLANIKADGRSRIEGTELTSIKAKNVDNAGVIGNKGTTYIEADSITNRSIGDQIAEITGDKTTLVAENDIFNIGSKISATDELNLISKNGNILNKSTIIETNRNYGDLNRTRHTELENIAEISSNNKLNIIADNYTSIAAKTNAKDLDIAVKENVNISSQKLSGEQKFGKDGSNFNAYAFESNIGSNVNAENINIDAKI
ncbi:beta strand repeat-containing protein, partial [Fusobacterium gastrosuis]|uniref:beta strand repeat-containing protein n=1 Tax=Fusobacterium gastrosuis TaxID=1755100 RepID=UPI00297A85F5|nr:hemolysin [Fusobacteriaceae bacterium]MDY5714007.1 hemolysin [Fusobacterium gastrosuis]